MMRVRNKERWSQLILSDSFGGSNIFSISALGNQLIFDVRCIKLHISQLIGFCIPYYQIDSYQLAHSYASGNDRRVF